MDHGEVQPTANAEAPSLNNGEATHDDNQVDLDDVIRRETHQRVLRESQKFKQRALEAEAKANALEEAKLTEQQQYKELADRYKSELEKVRQAKTELQLKTQLMPALSQAGCRDVTDAMKLGNSELLFGDDDSLNGVEEYVKDLQQRKPWLFDNGKPSSVNPSLPSPGRVPIGDLNKVDYSKMSKAELDAEISRLDAQFKASRR